MVWPPKCHCEMTFPKGSPSHHQPRDLHESHEVKHAPRVPPLGNKGPLKGPLEQVP